MKSHQILIKLGGFDNMRIGPGLMWIGLTTLAWAR